VNLHVEDEAAKLSRPMPKGSPGGAVANTRTRDPLRLSKTNKIQILLLILGLGLVAVGLVLVLYRSGVGPSVVTTTGGTPDTTVTTTSGQTALGSDTIDSFFLGSGLVLILVSAFYDRITSIGLPGGGSIALSPVAQAKVAAAVGKNLPDSEQIADAYKHAVATLSAQFWGYPATPSDEAIEAAAATAQEVVSQRAKPDARA
jgi:hypothetical protein